MRYAVRNKPKVKKTVKKSSSKYKGVYRSINQGKYIRFTARIVLDGGMKHIGAFKVERDAAIAYDMALIRNGEDPVNILKRKS
jgi:hypothetical protein